MHWYNRFHSSKKTIRNGFWGTIYFVAFAILAYNIVLSQAISPLYVKSLQDEKNSIGLMLESIQTLPEFTNLYLTYKNKYGTKIENEVFAEKQKDALYIYNLKEILKQSPYSRDVNYNLSQVLNKTNTDGEKYFIQATQIDPETH